jgi:hypothetical protein
MARFALAVVCVLLLSGCGSDDGDKSSAGPQSTVPTSECEPLNGGTLTKKVTPAPAGAETAFLTNAGIDIEDCVERVTFKFKDDAPGYDVSYQPEQIAKFEDGSGDPVAVAGGDFLVVRMSPAMTAEIDGEDVQPTYEGPSSIPAPTNARFVREVAKTGDFESRVTFVIGLDNKHPFTVTADGDELVVEIGA